MFSFKNLKPFQDEGLADGNLSSLEELSCLNNDAQATHSLNAMPSKDGDQSEEQLQEKNEEPNS